MTERIYTGQKADKYNSMSGAYFDPKEADGYSFSDIDVLQFLHGRRWDDYALAWVYGLRPSKIRVSTGAIHLDSIPNRVTVYIDENNLIEKIEQEIMVGMFGDLEDGHDLCVKTGRYKDEDS